MFTEDTILDYMKEQVYKPMTLEELKDVFSIRDDRTLQSFIQLLNDMERRGQVVRTRTNRYGLPEKMNLMPGTLQTKAKGYGFVVPDKPGLPDVYVNPGDMNGAMNGDRVLVRVHRRRREDGRPEGEIVRILERAFTKVVGVFKVHRHYALVTPDDKRINQDIFIAEEDFGGAPDGYKVVVEITGYPDKTHTCQGRVVEVLGSPTTPGIDILSVIRKYDLPEEFPDEVLREAERVPDTITPEEIAGRRDLRGRRMVTIDGEDAKDLDDAVSVERLPNGNIRLGVHIADVGYYVKEGSALDKEAFRRGCSVYLVDRVIPMLPNRLSNGICSLNPKADRLTLTCDMELDETANVVRHEIYESVIRTNERMTYTNVRGILEDHDPELLERYSDLVDDFRLMAGVALRLRERRMRRGAIDFDFPEIKVIVDAEGRAVDIRKRERSVAERIIEEFMLVANETVAEHFHGMNIPFLYRIHENPDPDRIQAFQEFANNFGYYVKGAGGKVHPRALQELLDNVKGKPEERVINTLLLRSMKQAKYAEESVGHFGLAARLYCHFTSPIRRYPDLVIHRIIREVLHAVPAGVLPERRLESLRKEMPRIALQSSIRERVAVEAERETESLKKAEYMLDKIGEEFEGIISGVTAFGLFVELDNAVEGLVHVSYLDDDYYHFHEKQMALVGERTGRTFRIGDLVKVKVVAVNKEERSIDFALVEAHGRASSPSRRGRGASAEGTGAARPGTGSEERNRKRKTPVAGEGLHVAAGTAATGKKPAKGRRRKKQRAASGKTVALEAGRVEFGRAWEFSVPGATSDNPGKRKDRRRKRARRKRR